MPGKLEDLIELLLSDAPLDDIAQKLSLESDPEQFAQGLEQAKLSGGLGQDALIGGAGQDTLSGYAGRTARNPFEDLASVGRALGSWLYGAKEYLSTPHPIEENVPAAAPVGPPSAVGPPASLANPAGPVGPPASLASAVAAPTPQPAPATQAVARAPEGPSAEEIARMQRATQQATLEAMRDPRISQVNPLVPQEQEEQQTEDDKLQTALQAWAMMQGQQQRFAPPSGRGPSLGSAGLAQALIPQLYANNPAGVNKLPQVQTLLNQATGGRI